ncbi:MAG: hypothetical protein KF699_17000 [Phycisphaeraceae bacterium]|nr:hypothetical protein [Phycisphaeraceae bacterium]
MPAAKKSRAKALQPIPAEQREEALRRSTEESRRRSHERELEEQQARAALDAQPITPSAAAEQLRALAEMPRGHRGGVGEEIAGSIVVRMARLGAFAAYPEARRLLLAHGSKPPTARRTGAWGDFAGAVRKQRGLAVPIFLETFSEDAAFVASLIETDPALAKVPGAVPSRSPAAGVVVAAADAVFDAWCKVGMYADRTRQMSDIGLRHDKASQRDRFEKREATIQPAVDAIAAANKAVETVDPELRAVTGERPREVLAKARPALLELESMVASRAVPEGRYMELMEVVATAQRVARGLDIAETRCEHAMLRDSAMLEQGLFQEVPVNETACALMARCFEELLALHQQAALAAPDSEQYCERDWERLDQEGSMLCGQIAGLAPRVAGELSSVTARAGLVSESAVRFAQSLRDGEWCLSDEEYVELVRLLRTGAATMLGPAGKSGKRLGELRGQVATAQRAARGLDASNLPTSHTRVGKGTSSQRRIKIISKRRVAVVEGIEYALPSPRHTTVIGRIVNAQGSWVSGPSLRLPSNQSERIDRLIKDLPHEVRSVIESNNRAGYRLKAGWMS